MQCQNALTKKLAWVRGGRGMYEKRRFESIRVAEIVLRIHTWSALPSSHLKEKLVVYVVQVGLQVRKSSKRTRRLMISAISAQQMSRR